MQMILLYPFKVNIMSNENDTNPKADNLNRNWEHKDHFPLNESEKKNSKEDNKQTGYIYQSNICGHS